MSMYLPPSSRSFNEDVDMSETNGKENIPPTSFYSRPFASRQMQTVYVEVLVRKSSRAPQGLIKQNVLELLKSTTRIQPGLVDLSNCSGSVSTAIESIRICAQGDDQHVTFHEVRPVVCVYQLNEEDAFDEVQDGQDDEEIVSASGWDLPSSTFKSLWESLVFESSVKENLLNYVTAALEFSDMKVDSSLITWNRVVLLHGPPGTGKTSLCKGLSQKLAIRLGHRYSHATLYEINAHSLFSKWFSESGKLVSRLFERIRQLADDEDSLVCVLIDEVESLTAARRAAANGSEPSDAIRVVNAVLTQLDHLKNRPNVIVLTTSNISEAIDVAFIDRADIKLYIGPPSVRARYDILRSCLGELQRVNIISDSNRIPRYMDWKIAPPGSKAGTKLNAVAELCEGCSGRTLRKLPFIARATQISFVPCSLDHYLDALLRTVQCENIQRERLLEASI